MYDSIIVGAGPAGATAALYLNKLGLKSLLLDKAIFPRDKVCGDALSGKSVRILDDLGFINDINNLDGAIIHRIIFANPEHSECELNLKHSLKKQHISHGYVIPRIIFDNYMIEKAKNVADFIDGFNVEELIINEGKVDGVIGKTSKGELKEFHSKIVIGADGPNSIVSRKVGLHNMDLQHSAIGIRCYYENVKGLTDQIELHYTGEINPGYFWIFPAGNNRANIGVGLLSSLVKQKRKKLVDLMDEIISSSHFKSRFKDSPRIGNPIAWSLPFGSIKRKNYGNGFLLIGDAAGLVDPFTGEGIGNAMVSGKIAAETIAEAKQKKDFSSKILSKYDKELWGFLGSELSTSTKLLKLAHSKILLNFVINRASRSNRVKEIISGMLANEIPKTELSNPLFYLKILFS